MVPDQVFTTKTVIIRIFLQNPRICPIFNVISRAYWVIAIEPEKEKRPWAKKFL